MSPVAVPSRVPSSAVRAGPAGVAKNKPGSPPDDIGSPKGFVTVIFGVAAVYTSLPSGLGAHATDASGTKLAGWP